MRSKTIYQIAAIAADNPEDFQKQFNKQMSLLSGNEPEATIDISNGFRAVIKYQIVEETVETVKDEYHLEGVRHICRECPFHDIETDARRKWTTCRYAENGETHLDHECCNYFYKMLKLGLVKPGEPNRSGAENKARCRK